MANRVLVEDLAVDMELGNNGIKLRVEDSDGRLRGYLQIGRAKLKWFHGKKQTPSREMILEDFIEWAEGP
jgi:hypothetical protein